MAIVTPAGGEILYLEAVLLPEAEELRLSGQLGDVMKESAVALEARPAVFPKEDRDEPGDTCLPTARWS